MAGVYLLVQGIWDIRTKHIPSCISIAFGICGFLYSISLGRAGKSFVLALLLGIGTLVLGKCTKEAVGYGDGILLCALGMFYTLEELCLLCMIAGLLATIVGLFYLIVFRKGRKYEIPFVPFLFISWLLVYGINIIGERI